MKNGTEAKAARLKRKMNQSEFWQKLGVTQSAGSRYENGRDIPKPVQTLLLIAYGKPHVAVKIYDTLRGGK